jgi:peptidoglycan-associated lipoprotein
MKNTLLSLFRMPALMLLFGLVGLAACKPEYPNCKKDKHCTAELGEKCVDGVCQGCQTDADCVGKGAEGQTLMCIDLRCQPPGTEGVSGRGEEGDPCTQRTDCFGGLACKAGVCAWCDSDVDCSPSTCNLDTGRCSAEGSCQVDDHCAMDEICDGGMCVFSGNLGDDSGGPCGLAAVFFGFDSDALTPKMEEELTRVADCIAEQNRRVFLEAHADNRGTEEYNILLTERRGNVVKRFLSERGVSGENLQVIAKGSLEAVGNDEPARSKERRVQFIWPE